ncbi:MAG: tRNA (adenosine(37)-N6)-threonylcarbamoyltransferase complex ATPase subunit type 1 TsaE [Gammaproteobacteria bacterium]|nr:MAG: tRNA (adenosine(37)-N6)-threonylcarbamoyltransferase complex ATPase subunit type 1 TsaE [Gammaproteobacteria bacterium]
MRHGAPAWQSVALPDEAATLALGRRLALPLARHPGLVRLEGPLGAGKTTLVRGLLRGLGHSGPVRSPTYTLIEPYEGLAVPVYHLDLYRLADPEELEWLGFRDLVVEKALLLVEWPERAGDRLPDPVLEIGLHFRDSEGREARLVPRQEALARTLIQSLAGESSGDGS